MRSFVVAWHFLTAVPLGRTHHAPTPGDLAGSMRWYPVVGLLIGTLLVATDRALGPMLARGVVDALLILLLVAVTRALHQDGLADLLDGLAGGRTQADRLAIMRDGRIGAVGATGLILDLGVRYAALEALQPADRAAVLLLVPALGRWSMVVACLGAPAARKEGSLAHPFLSHLSTWMVLMATLLVAGPVLWYWGPVGAVVTLGLTAGTARAMTAFCRRLLGGITGDTLGATNEVVEVLVLLAGPALASLR